MFNVCDDARVWCCIVPEKIDMLDFADFVAINKFDRKGSEDALRDVRANNTNAIVSYLPSHPMICPSLAMMAAPLMMMG